MAAYASYNVWVDRDGALFDIQIDYTIDAYIDPETSEYFGDTSWGASYGSGTGWVSGYGGESGTASISFGLDPDSGETVMTDHVAFSAMNTFSADSVYLDLDIRAAAYATTALTLAGGAGMDVIITGSGGDTVTGKGGNDTIDTGDGDDTASGGADNDMINGGNGNDRLSGDAGADVLYGGAGNDTLIGGDGADTMVGGVGNDTYYVDNSFDLVNETAASGIDRIYAVVDVNLSNTAMVRGDVETLVLIGTGNHAGTGNGLDNAITGNSGNNTLAGGGGNDTLKGGAGQDRLTGGVGADKLAGGIGADLFIVSALAESTVAAAGRDTILDFSHAQGDRIDLRGIDARADLTGNQAFQFIGTSAFSHQAGELRYRVTASGNAFVEGDRDGDGTADFSVLVNGVTAFQANDFLL